MWQRAGLGKTRMAENIHERLFNQAEHFDLRCACGNVLNMGTFSEAVADRWSKNPKYTCDNCLKNKICDVRPVPQPIDGELWADVVMSCSSCDALEIVRLTDLQWTLIKDGYNSLPPVTCAKCRGEVA
jgi:hypothetical protein